MSTSFLHTAAEVVGVCTFVWLVVQYFLNRRQRKADLSKTEGEVEKSRIESYLLQQNINDLVKKEAQLITNEYKDIIAEMQKEHYKIKMEWQGRLEKEMKARIESEQTAEILQNELHLIREEHQACLRQIDNQNKKIRELEEKVSILEQSK